MKKVNILLFFFLITALSFAVVGITYTSNLTTKVTSEYSENIEEEEEITTVDYIQHKLAKPRVSGGNDDYKHPTIQPAIVELYSISSQIVLPLLINNLQVYIPVPALSNFLLDYIQSLHFS